MDKLKFLLLFLGIWVLFAVFLYGVAQFSFIVKAYTDFGKTLLLWTMQLVAPVCACMAISIVSIAKKEP